MNNLSRLPALGIPVLVGIGIAWLGNRIIRNEGRLAERQIELELQLRDRPLKNLFATAKKRG
tara:strand:- start:293 stop:478 length:186 start_codon:yes stop_codon:yes gene_type:complete